MQKGNVILNDKKKNVNKRKQFNKINKAFNLYKKIADKKEEKNNVLNKQKYPPKKISRAKKLSINNYNQYNNNYSINNEQKGNYTNIRIFNKKDNEEEKIKEWTKIMEYNDEEKNSLNYQLAIKYDKRTYFEYYLSLIKTKHPLIFSFFNNEDYNSKIIKIDLFFISFLLNYAINALFFNDNTMHKIYEDKGSFNFIYQLPQIIYSSLISNILDNLLKLLALSEGDLLDYKKNKDKQNLKKRTDGLITKLNYKFILYFILSFFLLLFFWYYLSIFCAIYRNTQYHLIKDTLISFGLSLIYPFGIYLLPGFFRIPALSNPKNNKIYLFNFSQLFHYL